jgi:hypothetical protein
MLLTARRPFNTEEMLSYFEPLVKQSLEVIERVVKAAKRKHPALLSKLEVVCTGGIFRNSEYSRMFKTAFLGKYSDVGTFEVETE